jgi:hypothetical protein
MNRAPHLSRLGFWVDISKITQELPTVITDVGSPLYQKDKPFQFTFRSQEGTFTLKIETPHPTAFSARIRLGRKGSLGKICISDLRHTPSLGTHTLVSKAFPSGHLSS